MWSLEYLLEKYVEILRKGSHLINLIDTFLILLIISFYIVILWLFFLIVVVYPFV